MKISVLYHGDADGIMSAMVVKKAFMEKDASTEFLFKVFSYDEDFDPEMLKADKLLLVDASYGPDKMKEIKNILGPNFIWIDHHESAIKKVNLTNESYEGLRSIESAGCMLCWKYFYGMFSEAPLSVKQIDLYDRWIHTDEWQSLTQPLNLFISTYWRDPSIINPAFIVDDNFIRESAETLGQAIYLNQQQTAEHNMKSSVLKDIEINKQQLSVLAVNSSLFSSEMFEPYAKDHDMSPDVYMRYIIKGPKVTCSFYRPSYSQVNMAELAQSLSQNGGGHAAAAGATLQFKDFSKKFAKLFE